MTIPSFIVLIMLQAINMRCFADFNLIERIKENVTTSQSSIFSPNNNPQDFDSSKAIDGVQNYSMDTCKCCSVTNGNSPSWWQIDLKQRYLIGSLQIFGREASYSSQLEYAKVYVSNVSMKPGIASDKMRVYNVPPMNAWTRKFTKQLDAIIAQYFLVELNQKVLTLCEFKLNEEECKVGYFGTGCLHSCYCSDNNRCDQVTGKCRTPGCLAGWKGGACAEEFNLIECIKANVTTSQSSIYSPSSNLQDFNSSKAIDGVHNYSVDTCKCCSVTDGNPSWWQIDLGQKYLIGALQIFGRALDFSWQLEYATIYAGNVSMKPGVATNKMEVYNVPSMDARTRSFKTQLDTIIAQYVIVELNQTVLTLCEFKLYEKECKVGFFGTGCLHSCHCSGNNRCDQVTGKCRTPGCLAGWKGRACAEEFNLIERIKANVTTSQSSIYSPSSNQQDFNSSKAIDGVHNYSVDTCKCCSVTDGNPSWWQIDLGQKYLIGALQIFGRALDFSWQLEYATIYAGNVSMKPGVATNKMEVYNVPSMDARTRSFKTQLDTIIAQYFIVELNQTVLTLCEFKLYEKECDIGSFGSGCLHSCHCSDNNTCDQVTGKCQTPGCLAGWKGKACAEECYHGKFDIGCNKTCHCKDKTSCDHITGYCDTGLCDAGWLLPTCSQACGHRRFGQNCTSVCHCLNNASCNTISGECHNGICDPGWQTPSCDKDCGHRRFGQNCTSVCYCFNNASCNTISGECHNGICDRGWQTPSCDKACDFHTFGFNCSSTCHCINNTNCNSTTGECGIGLCDPGWQGSSCDPACAHRRFGQNCTSVCHCLNDSGCNTISGKCHNGICDPGWQTPSCDKACGHRRFGQNCTSVCHCLNNTSCNTISGKCHNGICDPGWQTPSCDKVCDYRTFGYNCSSTCHCLNNTDCNSSTGRCYIELCDLGWQGPRCDEEQNILRRLDVQTDMSSTFLNWTSNLAIDGNIGPKPDVCNCCSGTKNSPKSWWTVDLGKRYPINSVTVFSREFDQLYQQLADFELYLANDTGKISFHLVENSTRRIDGNKHVLTFSNKLTRFIKIQRPGVLTLCEVMVSEGECQVGTFGEECSEICHCGDDLACDKTSGHCQSDACKSGWIGKSCNQECPKNRFGDRCSETCFCAEGTCTSNYGVCQNGCQHGYTGSHCNQVGDFNNHTRPANEEKNSTALITVVVGGSIAGLIICVLVGVVVVKVRRKSSEGNKSHYSTPNSQANQPDQDYDTLDILNDNQGRRNTAYENEVVSNM